MEGVEVGMSNEEGLWKKGRRKKRRMGTQLDVMKKVRKDMPPATKVIQPRNKRTSSKNWRDYLEEGDFDNLEEEL